MGMYDNWQQQYNRQPYSGYGQMQSVMPQNPFLMVPTIADVDKVVAQSGETRWIMVQNDAVIAVKTANAMGYATTEYYRLTKFDPAAVRTTVQATDYVTSAQVDDKINTAIAQALAQLQQNTPKTNRSKEA